VIWLIGGTSESREIALKLEKRGHKTVVTTATDFGRKLYSGSENIKVVTKRMNLSEMKNFAEENEIEIIIDASHPYAAEVSENAIKTAEVLGIKYLRFERKSLVIEKVKNFPDYLEIVKYLTERNGNILLTIGSKNANFFLSLKERIFLRILPVTESISYCEKEGFSAENIVALKGPFSKEFNKALYNELKIKYLVTKESGEKGGVEEKVNAALELGLEVLMLKRPEVEYPECFYELESLFERIDALWAR